MRINSKLAIPSLIGLAIIILLIHYYWEPMQLKKAKDNFEKHTQELLVASESGIIQQILERDLGSLYSNMDYIAETYQNRWLNLTLHNEDNKQIYPLFKKKTDLNVAEENLIQINYPLSIGSSQLGRLELDVNWETEKNITISNLKNLRNMMICMILLILFITTLSQYQIIYKPLEKLIDASNKIKQGQFDAKLPKISTDEIGKLTSSFKEMSSELEFQKHALDEHAIVSATDKDGLITDINKKFVEITGFSRQELIGKTHQMIRSDKQSPEFFENMWATITRGKTWHGEVCNLNKQGETYWVSASIIPFMNESGVPERYLSIRTEITKQKKAEERLKYLADHDTLTSLPMRRLFQEKLSSALALARRNHSKAAVLFIDLDGFKAVNDSLGHNVGDQLLVNVAERLNQCIREVDTVARLGGDEFVILLSDMKKRDDISRVAKKIIEAMSSTFTLNGKQVSIGASVGVALYPDHGAEAEALIKTADDMMYSVKRKGKNNFAFYGESAET